MRGKNKTRRLKLKRSKLHSLKLRKRTKKTKKRGGSGQFKPGLKTVPEENPSGVRKRAQAKSPRKASKTLSQVKPPSPPPVTSEYAKHQKFVNSVKKTKKAKEQAQGAAEIEDYGLFDHMMYF